MNNNRDFSINEMENIFEIGRIIEARASILPWEDSKDAFAFALKCAQEFEKEYPGTEDYYGDIDEFMDKKFREAFN